MLIKILHLRELSNLLMGGTAVETCIDGSIALRTVVQLDGDVLTFVLPSASTNESIYKKHWESVEDTLATISNQLNGVVRRVSLFVGALFALIFVGFKLYETFLGASQEVHNWISISVALLSILVVVAGNTRYIPWVSKLLQIRISKLIWFVVDRHIKASATNILR